MTSSDLIALVAAAIVVLTAAATGLATYLGRRRAARGTVDTSEAAILWQQSQDIRAMLLAEKTKAEEQRDRLIDAYTRQIFPVLTEVNTAVVDIADTMAELVSLTRVIRASLGGGGHAEAAESPAPGARPERR